MAHTQAEIVQSRIELSAAIHTEIEIHYEYIKALKNALAGMKAVAAVETPVPIDQKIVNDMNGGTEQQAKRPSLMGMLRRDEATA